MALQIVRIYVLFLDEFMTGALYNAVDDFTFHVLFIPLICFPPPFLSPKK